MYKSKSEQSTPYEVAAVCFTCPVVLLLRHNILAYFFSGGTTSVRCQFIVDFICICVSGVMCLTVTSSNQEVFITVLLLGVGVLLVLLLEDGRMQHESVLEASDFVFPNLLDLEMPQPMRFMTYFRAFVILSSVGAILGVDFRQVFPARFNKSPTYGSSLMDVGVGGFMVAGGLACKEAKRKRTEQKSRDMIKNSMKSTLPLWVLGFSRALIAHFTKYHVHTIEYGLHWNFFLTLATVKTISTMLFVLIPPSFSIIVAILIAVVYEFVLEILDFKTIIITSTTKTFSRDGLFDANREGICSCVGYLAIYLASVGVGRFLAQTRPRFRNWLQTMIILLLMSGVFWLLLVYSLPIYDQISRRMANITFIIWMMAHNIFMLSAFLVVDIVEVLMQYACMTYRTRHSQPDFCLMEAVNRNGLFVFLLANLLTAVFNYVFTLDKAQSVQATITLVVYMLILSLAAAGLYVNNISTKFW